MPNAQEVLDWTKWDKERKANMTNEEWFCSLPTKEKAKEMCVIMADMAEANDGVWDEEMIEEWLKEKHHA